MRRRRRRRRNAPAAMSSVSSIASSMYRGQAPSASKNAWQGGLRIKEAVARKNSGLMLG
jgi:hypothetical protein